MIPMVTMSVLAEVSIGVIAPREVEADAPMTSQALSRMVLSRKRRTGMKYFVRIHPPLYKMHLAWIISKRHTPPRLPSRLDCMVHGEPLYHLHVTVRALSPDDLCLYVTILHPRHELHPGKAFRHSDGQREPVGEVMIATRPTFKLDPSFLQQTSASLIQGWSFSASLAER